MSSPSSPSGADAPPVAPSVVQSDTPTSQMLTLQHSQRFMASDLSLLQTGQFSDVVLRCGHEAWALHKSIICKRSKWFERALTGNFEEAETRKITLQNMAPEPIDVVVRYLYSGVIDTAAVQKCHGDSMISKLVGLFSTADFFLLQPLKTDLLIAMQENFEANIKVMNDAKWEVECAEGKAIVQDFFHAVVATYQDFPHAKPCREVVIDYAHAIRLNLYRSNSFVQRIAEFPELASDLFQVAVKGRKNKWVGNSDPDYGTYCVLPKCTGCACSSKETASWHVDPKATRKRIRTMEARWKCETCVEKSGFLWEGRDEPRAEK